MRIFATYPLPGDALASLASTHQVDIFPHDRAPTSQELGDGIKQADILICLLRDKIDKALLKAAPQLKIIANYAVGTDNIDVTWATVRDIVVLNTPRVLTDATADQTFALLLATARRLCEGDRMVRQGQWNGWEPNQLLGTQVSGKTLGIVGMGRIGEAVARRARGFCMRILYHNRHRLPIGLERELGATLVPLETLLAQSDFVSLHCPLTPATQHLLHRERLFQMKPGSILINTARGAIVDEAALVDALTKGPIAAAGLDVFEQEPQVHPGLLANERVVLAPHLGSATHETRQEMANTLVRGILALLEHQRPPNIVNPEVLPA